MTPLSRRIILTLVALSVCGILTTPQAVNSSPYGRIVEMHLEAVPHNLENATCPATINFNGFIRTDGPNTVTYGITRSDGGRGEGGELHFTRAESLRVHFTWRLGAPGQTYNEWEQIGSGTMRSNRAEFHLHCRR